MRETQTPYDNVFHTLLNDVPRFSIPVVNEIFGTTYQMRESVTFRNNELFVTSANGEQQEKITDSCFQIQNTLYHLECQSTLDKNMAVRMYEYDTLAAIREMKRKDDTTVQYPCSAVLYLRSNRITGDGMRIKITGRDFNYFYCTRVIKIQNYTIEKLFEKELYFLLPFLGFRYEDRFSVCEGNEEELRKLLDDFQYVRDRLDSLKAEGKLNDLEKWTLLSLSNIVNQSLTKKYQRVRKELEKIMGGEILDYEAKTILNQGMKEGRKEGREEGKKEGKEEESMLVFHNMLSKGYSREEAQEISELSDEQVYRILDE